MTDRQRAGSGTSGQGGPGDQGKSRYPGEQLGLPEEGPRSVAGIGRRLLALIIDWLLCLVIATALFPDQVWTSKPHVQFWPVVIFAVEVFLLTALTGFTVGKRLVGIRVARLDGQPVGFGRSLVRVLLLLLVVPPLVFDRDLRGLHDRAANTVVIRA